MKSDNTKHKRHGAELSEAIAVHEAVKWGLTRTEPITVHYDSKTAGQAAEGTALVAQNIAQITTATRGLVELAQTRGQAIAFEHVKLHEGCPSAN